MLADIIVVAVVAAFVAMGYKKGLMKSLISIVSYVVSIILSFLLYPILSQILMKTPLYTFFVEKIGEKLLSAEAASGELWGKLLVVAEHTGTDMGGAAASAIAQLLINIVSFIMIVIVFKIAIRLIGKTLNLFTKLPVIKQFNRLGGAIAGGLIGILAVYIAFAAAIVFAPIDNLDKITSAIEDSMLAGEMYNNNFILNFLDGEE